LKEQGLWNMEGRLSTLFLRLLPAAYMAFISTSYTIQSLLKDDDI
jgi:hypothetical protein